ncbi:bifunctional [glutamine synthetase] adenylyltransferase/[glutamine synthetase]-adenylyl-L-tyrosine phosphorylase [Desertibaculum subflavum]|uniref:bifunctional [glutamine synthetase] adenylyltransferase/[glutamine synthetase]-adenylyl-L-tyrosine phosphorylase n=1 Tax=Desertibaculum subflavum TaxID=2268458 RepID=UPI000E6708F5
MTEFPLLERLARLPQAADPDRARHGRHDLLSTEDPEEADLAPGLQAFMESPQGQALSAALFGNSPFLGDCVLKERRFLLQLLASDPDTEIAKVLGDAGVGIPGESEAELMTRLRRARRRAALLIAIADIGGLWTLDRITWCLTRFADAAVRAATAHYLRQRALAGDIELPHPDDPERESGFAVIGMGKIGADELNYSSDIDLVVFFDEDHVRLTGTRFPRDIYSRVVHGIVKALQERTADGYVHRVDLRLRPDAGATPVAMSMAAAESYYESFGQNWERAAMIKARPVAGDLDAGARLLARLEPFVWRKNLDYAAIADIHSIKRQINAHKGHKTIAIEGHDIKVGAGGIREIEFFAQTQQLISGGRDRRLRSAATCETLRALMATGRVSEAVGHELIEAYGFLRTLEHRLQMVEDQQTQKMPATADGVARIATFMGYDEPAPFERDLRRRLEMVRRHYAALFESAPTLGSSGGNLVFTGTEDDPDTLETLTKMGFREPARIAATVRGWHHGHVRAMRSARARELMTELVPSLLAALGKTAHPDLAFNTFDTFLGNLPAGVQILSLLHANPGILGMLAEIMGTAPRLAEVLARTPALLDAILSPEFRLPPPEREAIRSEIGALFSHAGDIQDVLDMARRYTRESRFQIGARMLGHSLDVERVGFALSDLADGVLDALAGPVEADIVRQHGRVPGGRIAIVGLGKLGAREMTFGSDLDLILVYDHAPDAESSSGAKPLVPSVWFTRFTQRYINALTALTGEGQLYDVDMRLRPSGTKGPIAVPLAAFARYHREEAWTWEHMALTRARVVGGDASLGEEVAAVIRDTLAAPRDADKLLADVADMRRKIAAQHAATDPWEVKYARGGLLDLEFLAQYLVLRHAAAHPSLLTGNTADVFRTAGNVRLLPAAEARRLTEAILFLRAVQNVLRLCVSGRFEPQRASSGLGRFIAKVGGCATYAGLARRLKSVEAWVAGRYEAHIARPAEALDAPPGAPILAAAGSGAGEGDGD